jgi:hypothetical protein
MSFGFHSIFFLSMSVKDMTFFPKDVEAVQLLYGVGTYMNLILLTDPS